MVVLPTSSGRSGCRARRYRDRGIERAANRTSREAWRSGCQAAAELGLWRELLRLRQGRQSENRAGRESRACCSRCSRLPPGSNQVHAGFQPGFLGFVSGAYFHFQSFDLNDLLRFVCEVLIFLVTSPALLMSGIISGTLYTHRGQLRSRESRDRRVGRRIGFPALAEFSGLRKTQGGPAQVLFLG